MSSSTRNTTVPSDSHPSILSSLKTGRQPWRATNTPQSMYSSTTFNFQVDIEREEKRQNLKYLKIKTQLRVAQPTHLPQHHRHSRQYHCVQLAHHLDRQQERVCRQKGHVREELRTYLKKMYEITDATSRSPLTSPPRSYPTSTGKGGQTARRPPSGETRICENSIPNNQKRIAANPSDSFSVETKLSKDDSKKMGQPTLASQGPRRPSAGGVRSFDNDTL